MGWLSKELLFNTLNISTESETLKKTKSANLPLIIQMSECSHLLVYWLLVPGYSTGPEDWISVSMLD